MVQQYSHITPPSSFNKLKSKLVKITSEAVNDSHIGTRLLDRKETETRK